MPPPFDAGETVLLQRRVPTGTYDAYGNVIYKDVSETVAGVAIWPESASEQTQNVERTNNVYRAMFPADVAIDTVDHINWRGKDYEVHGDPERYQSPLSGTTLQVIRMARVEG